MVETEAQKTYLAILAEIKHRLETVRQVLDGEVALKTKIVEELCYLQFRMVSELIAIGCLVLHEDIALSQEGVLAKAWNAGQIFKRLSRLHGEFYPQPLAPVTPELDKFNWDNLKAPYMTKEELIEIYDKEFGQSLHRGSFRKIFKEDPPLDFAKLRKWHLHFVNLLNRHIVHSADGQYVCHFNMCPLDQYPTCSLFQAQDD